MDVPFVKRAEQLRRPRLPQRFLLYYQPLLRSDL